MHQDNEGLLLEMFSYCRYKIIKTKGHSINIWTVKIKIAVVRLVKSLVIFILPGCYYDF
jgi:hypothetical protein